jgi:pimeloyl-ACP methyl ester carboxylesterase
VPPEAVKRAAAGDVEIAYESFGDPADPPVVLVMGLGVQMLGWRDGFCAGLAERGCFVVRFDNRDTGLSTHLHAAPPPDLEAASAGDASSAAYTLSDMARDTVALLDALELDSAHVLGISMGGMVAQELALRHPDRLRTLTLGCTYPGGPGARLTDDATIQRLATAILSGDREASLRAGWDANVSADFGASDDRYAVFRRMAMELPVALEVLMAQMQAIQGHDPSARLGKITAPTLVVHGTADRMLDASNAELIARLIPGARLELLDGVGHMFYWEQPERAAQLVREHALGGVGAPVG